MALYPLNAWLIAVLGWRMALVAFGCIVAAATVSLTLLYREPPTKEKLPTGGAYFRALRETRVAGEAWTLRRALRSVRLWSAFAMTGLGVIGFQIMATHQVAHAVDRGFPQPAVVWLFAFGAGCMMAGNLLGCLALMRGPQDLVLLLLYTLSLFGFGMRIAQLSTIPADVFAGPHLGAILGVVQAGGGLGGAIGPFLGGWLFDVTGSYGLAFMAACVAVAGSAVAAWFAARPATKQPGAQRS